MPVSVASLQDIERLDYRIDAARKPDPPWVGIYVGNQTGTSDLQALFTQAYLEMGHLSYVRCFDSSIKSPTSARFLAFKGPKVHYSLKPNGGDHAGFAAGNQSAAFVRLVSALPAGARLSVWHEPENDMPGSAFLAMTQQARNDLKAVRPDVELVYTSMAYQWETNSKGNVTDSAPWLEAAKLCDSVSTDVYAPPNAYVPMAERRGFQVWMDQIVGPAGKPWGVTERGIDDHNGESARMKILAADIQYVLSSGCSYFYYWHSDWQSNDASHGWALKGASEKALYRSLAAHGRSR